MSQKRQILIVDDDGDLRMALAEQLSLHPEFAVGEAEDVAGARTAVSNQNPDLVIMDIGLPDMDGREAVACCARRGSSGRSSC